MEALRQRIILILIQLLQLLQQQLQLQLPHLGPCTLGALIITTRCMDGKIISLKNILKVGQLAVSTVRIDRTVGTGFGTMRATSSTSVPP